MSNTNGSYGYSTPLPAPRTAPPVAVPRLLSLAVGVSLAASGLYLATAVLGFLSGRAALESELRAGVGVDSQDLLTTLAGPAIDAAYGTLKMRAGIIGVLAVVAVLLAFAALRASLVARIALVLTLLVALAVALRTVTDVYPGTGIGTGWAAIALTPVAAVMLFLPAVNRYRSASRSR